MRTGQPWVEGVCAGAKHMFCKNTSSQTGNSGVLATKGNFRHPSPSLSVCTGQPAQPMSRVPPFPASRHSSSSSQTPQASSTRPLHIPRPARVTRPESPNTIPIGPARPRRSELRGRTVENDTERASSVALEDQYRDSVSTTHSAMSGQLHPQQEVSRPPASRKATEYTTNGVESSSTSLASALDAFHFAGTSRRRRMTNGSDEFNYQRQRQEEIEAEKARQQRYQERALKKTRTARAGDIDGMYSCLLQSLCSLYDKLYSMRSKMDGSL